MIDAKATPEQFESVRDWLSREEGVQLAGNEGTIRAHGIRAEYHYDGERRLTIDVTDSPFLFPKSLVETKIRQGLALHGVTSA